VLAGSTAAAHNALAVAAMQRFLQLFSSSRSGNAPEAPSGPVQSLLPLDDAAEPAAPVEPALPASRHGLRGSSALRTAARPSMSVALATTTPATPTPTLPTALPPTAGVVLTQTERVRLKVMQAQIRLAGLALYEGPIDGMLTLETATALRYFQTLKGLRESGQPTAATLRALGIPNGEHHPR
jgi:hypothetical protein